MEQITNKPSRIRRNNQQILNLLNEFEKSDVSVKEFCEMHSISKATFHKWQSRYRSNLEKRVGSPGFAHLQITSSANIQAALFAEVGGIKIYQPVAALYLKELSA